MEDHRLGAILLEGGIVDESGLERCLSIQALTGSTRPIGSILVEQGLLDETTLKRLLELQQVRTAATSAGVVPGDLGSSSLLEAAAANGASELVVSEGRPARVQVGGCWRQLTEETLSGPEVWDLVRETMGSDVLEQLAERHFVVRPWQRGDLGRGTATAFRHFEGVAVRLVFAPSEAPSQPADLGVPQPILDAIASGRGLVLCVGERGIGRGPLLSSLTGEAAKDEGHYVVVVDDEPMELPQGGALVVQRRFGIDPVSRADALRSVVREDPDTIVIADVGSSATFELALRAAEGGRLVIACIDAEDSIAALGRILNFYPDYDLPRVRASLAAVLRGVLVRHVLPGAAPGKAANATELLLVEGAASELVRDGDLADLAILLRDASGSFGYPLDQSLLELLTAGEVSMEDVFARASEKARLIGNAPLGAIGDDAPPGALRNAQQTQGEVR